MKTLDAIKTDLIDKISTSQNEKLLRVVYDILDSSSSDHAFSLDSAQIEMLMMSEKDIANNSLVSESELKKMDEKWLG